jgi:hypothetical protein
VSWRDPFKDWPEESGATIAWGCIAAVFWLVVGAVVGLLWWLL